MSTLSGKRAIITGAASGIGRASARLFAERGASVVISDVAAEGLAETEALISGAGGRCVSMVADVSESDAVEALVRRSVEAHGGLDIFYANAGISGGLAPLLDLEPSDWMALLKVNLVGPFLAIKHAARQMTPQGAGAILCTASVAGLRANAGGLHYSASKAAVISLVQTASLQLSGTGIRVNAICPGLIETGMTRPIFELARAQGKAQRIGQLNPLRRAGQPEEIARVAAFLCSDEASYVNGQAWAVDGGLSASHPFVVRKS